MILEEVIMNKPLIITLLPLCLIAGLSLPPSSVAMEDVNQDGQLIWIADTGGRPLTPGLLAEARRAIERLALLTGYAFVAFNPDPAASMGDEPELILDLSARTEDETDGSGADLYQAAATQIDAALGLDQLTPSAGLAGRVGGGSGTESVESITFRVPGEEAQTVPSVPLPPSLGLLGIALAALGLVRRRTESTDP